ncbi:SpoIIE family protein phosphatase [Streptomyces sp. KL116D]|uniref:SpoIIE family protein phosphatase n=1 Tax=Streptomyces sp. KL116D TaxID=3045152 RepID=UPI003558AB09
MCLLVLDTRSGTMDIVNAGHLPLARHLTRRRRGLLCPSMARCWASTSITSPPRPPWPDDGDLLLMVTDGLIERPRIDLAVSLEDLLPAPPPSPAPCSPCATLLRHYSEDAEDDIALLAVRRRPPPSPEAGG